VHSAAFGTNHVNQQQEENVQTAQHRYRLTAHTHSKGRKLPDSIMTGPGVRLKSLGLGGRQNSGNELAAIHS